MAKLSADEIAGYAQEAGFKGEEVKIATAIALAESGGDPRSHNSTPPDNSYGLWQINMLGSMGPARRKDFGITSNEQLFDPRTNARAAYIIYKRSGWTAWTTYTRGTYKRNDIQELIKKLDPRNVGKEIAETAKEINPINGVSDSINAFGKTIFKGFANTAGILVAIGLLAAGVVFLVMSSDQTKKGLKTALNVVPAGKAATAAKAVVK